MVANIIVYITTQVAEEISNREHTGVQAYFMQDLVVFIGMYARHEYMFAIHHASVVLYDPLTTTWFLSRFTW
jgi:hypothetical protein